MSAEPTAGPPGEDGTVTLDVHISSNAADVVLSGFQIEFVGTEVLADALEERRAATQEEA